MPEQKTDTELDLSRMFELPKCAVHCGTEEEASALVDSMRQQYPGFASHFSSGANWRQYGNRTCYTLFYSGDREATGLSRTRMRWFLDNGYEVIEFSDLLNQPEIEESDIPIEMFLA